MRYIHKLFVSLSRNTGTDFIFTGSRTMHRD